MDANEYSIETNGPAGNWLTGHLSKFRADRLNFYTRLARDHGDVVLFRILGYRILLISDPALIEQILVTQSDRFIKHFGARLCKPLLGNGLVTSECDFWRRQRKLAAPAFQAARIAPYSGAMVRAVEQMIGSWAHNETRDIQTDMMRFTLGVACQTLFGAETRPNSDVVGQAMQTAMESLVHWAQGAIPLPQWVPTPVNLRFRRSLCELDAIVERLIDSRRQKPPGDDLLWALLSARDDRGQPMNRRQLIDEVRTLFIAGHETTALTLTYSLFLLASHPLLQDRLQRELASELGSRPTEISDLPKLQLLRGVLMESLRLYPPADTIGREAAEDCTIGPLRLRKSTNIFMSQWVVHRDARFFPNPDQFAPERWTAECERRLRRFAFFPFGGGPRACIGQTFAMNEAMLVLATLCRGFSFAPDPTYRLELRPTLTLRPKENVRLMIHRGH